MQFFQKQLNESYDVQTNNKNNMHMVKNESFTLHLEWPHLNSWVELSWVVNKQGQRAKKTALKMF